MTDDVATAPLWQDPGQPLQARVEALITEMTIEEKAAQLIGVWVGASAEGGDVAPHQHDLVDAVDLDALLPTGLGQLTRPFGSAPVNPGLGALSLMRAQARIVAESRFGIPALAHEECLAGFATLGATAYPVPLAWGATFNPELVERMARNIGNDMRAVGVHQGLAPVLDVVRDARWGRVEETIGEDPYLIGTIGTAYVRGLEAAGVVATLKHFVGYSASRAGRNLAPVSMGTRELADVLLPPFEMVIREANPGSVMHAYTDIDGVPSAADVGLLTTLLRDTWGFEGTVVADYFGVAFLNLLHGVAGSLADAARLALTAGVDVELPTVTAFGKPLVDALHAGDVDIAIVDRAVRRVLLQKAQLGLLDADWSPVPPALQGVDVDDTAAVRTAIDLDTAGNRDLARQLAEQSVVLLRNDGVLPLAPTARIAAIGPTATDSFAVLGCYSFPAHVGVQHPGSPVGIELPTLVEALSAEFSAGSVTHEQGTTIDGFETDGFDAAVAAAKSADVAVVALGDRAGLFGRGTSGEGCDAESLALPGAQQQLLDAIIATGTPVVVVLLAGRPYALGGAATKAAAIVQTFFPGEEGTPAIAGVLSGRVNPSGRLPVSVPALPGTQPTTYLSSPLGQKSGVSNIDPTAAFAFGHGLSYSTFEWTALDHGPDSVPVDGTISLGLSVRNTSTRDATEIVQLYLHDPVATVVRPVQRLIGYYRVDVAAGEEVALTVSVPAELANFTSISGDRIVEPGEIVLGFGRSSAEIVVARSVQLTGETRVLGTQRAFHASFAARSRRPA